MKTSLTHLCLPASLTLMLLISAGSLLAQSEYNGEMKLSNSPPQARFTHLPPRLRTDVMQAATAATSTPLQTWNGSFSYGGRTYKYNMVGAAPSTNTSATVPVYIIPVKIVITKRRSIVTFDPSHILSNGSTVTHNTAASPLFDKTTTYTQGGVDVGTTQYIDAYQRANFWGTVKTHPNSHLLLSQSVLAEQTLSPSKTYGKTGSVFGFTAALVDINWFDSQIPNLISKLAISPNQFPIFLLYDTYLTQGGGCCIGGYHSSEGSVSNPQAYAEATYVDHVGAFSQDVSALSHEIGEWADDPLTVNFNGNNT